MEDFNCDEMIDRAVYGDRCTQQICMLKMME